MTRTESKSIQVHPDDEQAQINLMQQFHWNLIGSQEVKTVDNSVETRGDSVYNVRTTEHYVKLTFSRDLSNPHLPQLRKLESEYFGMTAPKVPSLFPGGIVLHLILAVITMGISLALWAVYLFAFYMPKKAEADQAYASNHQRRHEIMQQALQFA